MPYVFIATPMYGGLCHGSYAASLFRTVPVFMNAGVGLQYAFTVNESLVPRARDSLVHDFLASECTHLMFIDSDIGFAAEDILSMVDAGKDVICGLYPRKEIDWEQVAAAVGRGVAPADLPAHTGSLVVNTLPGAPPVESFAATDSAVEVANAGTGFMLIRREVFELLAAEVPVYKVGTKQVGQFFDMRIDETATLLSEDFSFCRRVRGNGFMVWAAPWVRLTHTGAYQFGGGR